MNVRTYKDSDAERIGAIHEAMGLDYRMIDLSSPSVIGCEICEKDGQMVGAIALKQQAETYLWLDPAAQPAVKWLAIKMLQREIAKSALRIGIEQLVAYLPDCIGARFMKRVVTLGWEKPRDGWTPIVYEVKR